jgi:hypothetical protein
MRSNENLSGLTVDIMSFTVKLMILSHNILPIKKYIFKCMNKCSTLHHKEFEANLIRLLPRNLCIT